MESEMELNKIKSKEFVDEASSEGEGEPHDPASVKYPQSSSESEKEK